MKSIQKSLPEHLRVHKAVPYLSHSVLYFFDIFTYKLLILYERKLNIHKIGYFKKKSIHIKKQANVVLINTYPRFLPFFTI